MRKRNLAKLLADIDFPVHVATYKAAIKGANCYWGPMNKEDALSIARVAMFFSLIRAWEAGEFGA